MGLFKIDGMEELIQVITELKAAVLQLLTELKKP